MDLRRGRRRKFDAWSVGHARRQASAEGELNESRFLLSTHHGERSSHAHTWVGPSFPISPKPSTNAIQGLSGVTVWAKACLRASWQGNHLDLASLEALEALEALLLQKESSSWPRTTRCSSTASASRIVFRRCRRDGSCNRSDRGQCIFQSRIARYVMLPWRSYPQVPGASSTT